MAVSEGLFEASVPTQANIVIAGHGSVHKEAYADANHLFANNVRFLSMAAIIAVHSVVEYLNLNKSLSVREPISYFEQPFKFGTIAFFWVAGFLFGERVNQYTPLEYLKRRLRVIFTPWLIWFSLDCLLAISGELLQGHTFHFSFKSGLDLISNRLLGTTFWFVPNLLIALTILLCCRRFLPHAWFGAVLFAASLFYSINIYGHWIQVEHTRAAFGFVFYLWLGAWSAWHFDALQKWVVRIPAVGMLGLVLVGLILALAESKLLFVLGARDPMNTLRIGNVVYSLVVVLAVLKMRKGVSPHFVSVRQHTFGLYLTHNIVLSVFYTGMRVLLPRFWLFSSGWETALSALAIISVMFVATYAFCLLVVSTLVAHPKLSWTVGATGRLNASKPAILKSVGHGDLGRSVERKFTVGT